MLEIDLRKAAFYLIPLILISPSINAGDYAILITDLLIIIIGLLLINKGQLKIKFFFFIFILLFTLGWIGASLCGLLRYGIPLQIAELNHLYRIFFYYSAFLIGYKSTYNIEEIVSSKLMRGCIMFLGIFVLLYFLVDGHTRAILLKLYSNNDVNLYANRFPGLNSNINIFSFIVFIAALFNFHYLLKGNKKLLVPSLILLFVIIAGLSRKNIAFLIVYIIITLIYTFFISKKNRILKGRKLKLKRLIALSLILITVLVAGIKFIHSPLGNKIIASYKILIFSNEETAELRAYYIINSDFSARGKYMHMGIERIKLAPVLGVPKIRGQKVDNKTLLFHKAHNEFIVIWMYYGLLGLIAFIILIGYIILYNLQKKEYTWVYLYLVLFLQAFFDTAFFSYHLCSILFIFIGLNFNIHVKKEIY